MSKLYKKVGRRYVEVGEYDREAMDYFPHGDHLVSVRPGNESRRYNIDPALAPLIAAGLYAEDAIVQAIYQAQEIRTMPVKLTKKQQELVNELTASMRRQDSHWLRPGARDAAEAGVQALQAEAQRRMKHPAVKEAYERFLLVAKLCEERDV